MTNANDSNNSLLPLRGWLAKHTDTDSRDCRTAQALYSTPARIQRAVQTR